MRTVADRLDPYFRSIGVEPRSFGLSGRKYEGTYGARTLTASCSVRTRTVYHGEIRRTRYAGHQLSVRLGTPLRTRLVLAPATTVGLGAASWVNRRSGMTLLDDLGPEFEHLVVWVHEPDWARRLLQDPWARQTIRYLQPPDSPTGVPTINLGPEKLLLSQRLVLNQLDPTMVGHRVEALANLLQAAEALPAPALVAEATWLETKAEESPGLIAALLFGAAFAVLGVFALFLVVLIVTLTVLF